MSKTGPKTPEGIRAVTRNLPAPEKSGPRTEEGKRKSCLNSLKHGLTIDGFLPCKKEGCYFYEVCGLWHSYEGRKILDATTYGDSCPGEVIAYYDIRHGLAREGICDETWAHMWAMNEVHMVRRRMLSAVDVDIVREVPTGFEGHVRPELALAFRYQDKLRSDRDALLRMLVCRDQ
ncbi:MAG TPA: hypothetical protein PKX17_04840 [Candidatus Methanomethylicus sp.]|nr:hypothetical protein [Candidatus Methanomethylicus sp.]